MVNIVFLDSHTVNPGDLSLNDFNTFGNFTAYDRTSPDDIIKRSIDADIVIVNKVKLMLPMPMDMVLPSVTLPAIVRFQWHKWSCHCY